MAAEHLGARHALVVGASQGIGLALVHQILRTMPGEHVYATHRGAAAGSGLDRLQSEAEGRLSLLRCDVTDDASLEKLAASIDAADHRLHLVMHCAGILHEPGLAPEKALGQVSRAALQRVFDVNAFGPLLLARAVLPLVPKHEPAHFAALSAMVGSIGDNRLGGWYGYRASKAALNQFFRTLAIEAQRTHPQLCVSLVHPGTTDTRLSRPFQANVREDRLYRPEQSAGRILEVVLDGRPENSGRFVNWDGSPIPW